MESVLNWNLVCLGAEGAGSLRSICSQGRQEFVDGKSSFPWCTLNIDSWESAKGEQVFS